MQPDRARLLLQKATLLLLKLFEADKPFVISNKSLIVLVQGFSSRLDQGLASRNEEELLKTWERRLPNLKKEMIALAEEDLVVLPDGRERPLMTERKADKLLNICPYTPEF